MMGRNNTSSASYPVSRKSSSITIANLFVIKIRGGVRSLLYKKQVSDVIVILSIKCKLQLPITIYVFYRRLSKKGLGNRFSTNSTYF